MNDFDYLNGAVIKFVDLREVSLEQALVEIEKMPWLWLAETNLACLKSFIVGWLNSRLNYEDERFIKNFTNFVLTYYEEQNSSMGWYEMLISKNIHETEKKKVEKFYYLFSEYITSKKK
jgi:hypothetical protein